MTSKILAIVLVLCVGNSIAAQSTANATRPAVDNPKLSDANFAVAAQQIRELNRPEFRAALRSRLLAWTRPNDTAERRQASMALGEEALSDLNAHRESISPATASWLYELIARALRNFAGADADGLIAKYELRKDEGPSPSRDLADAIKALGDPVKAGAAREKATEAILTGQIPSEAVLGDLLRLQQSNSPALPDLLAAMLIVEERQAGFIPLRMIPFFSAPFLAQTTPTKIQVRFLQMVVARTRNPTETSPVKGAIVSNVRTALSAIVTATKDVAPALYPEVVARLTSLGGSPVQPEREAAEARIKASSDQLEQLQWEADHASSPEAQRGFLVRAAGLALTQSKFIKAVDLQIAAYGERPQDATYLDRLLTNVSSAALKQKQPEAAEYAIAKMAKPLDAAENLIQLIRYYGNFRDNEKRKAAIADAMRSLEKSESNNDKLKVSIALVSITSHGDASTSYDAMRLTVDTINTLPTPAKEKEDSYYLSFLQRALELIDAFRSFNSSDEGAALALAQDIKFPELRVAALLGVYSSSK